ncbi:hypothetical protein Peur_002775 [Populus x canadensis]
MKIVVLPNCSVIYIFVQQSDTCSTKVLQGLDVSCLLSCWSIFFIRAALTQVNVQALHVNRISSLLYGERVVYFRQQFLYRE